LTPPESDWNREPTASQVVGTIRSSNDRWLLRKAIGIANPRRARW
jgi:hypothetical protein